MPQSAVSPPMNHGPEGLGTLPLYNSPRGRQSTTIDLKREDTDYRDSDSPGGKRKAESGNEPPAKRLKSSSSAPQIQRQKLEAIGAQGVAFMVDDKVLIANHSSN